MGNNSNGYKPFVADEWALDTGTFGEELSEEEESGLTLVELLARPEKEFDIALPSTKISTRCTQPTLTAVLHLFSVTERVSVAKVEKVASKQGLRLIREGKESVALKRAFDTRLQGVVREYDADRSARLGQRTKLLPTDASNDRGDIRVYQWVHGALSDMAYSIGMPISYLAIFCLLYSLATVTDLGAYRPIVLQDIERFRKYLDMRAGDLASVVS